MASKFAMHPKLGGERRSGVAVEFVLERPTPMKVGLIVQSVSAKFVQMSTTDFGVTMSDAQRVSSAL